MDSQRFHGRVAVVTGGSGGLGQAIVLALAQEGAMVASIARQEGGLDRVRSLLPDQARLLTLAADLQSADAAEQAMQRVVDWGGRLDVAVNTAGGYAGGTPFAEGSLDDWRRMLDGNLAATMLAMRAEIPHMLRQGGGRIVNVSSRTAQRVGRNVAAYAVAKAGIETLTQAAAEDYRDRNVTINAVAPSVIATPAMLENNSAKDRARWVAPESLAGVILFLASDAAADISGAIVPVFGRA
jgi:NAD(P)-dependent dehydrogenase (short-subunit alcohol dehydrogenase family)